MKNVFIYVLGQARLPKNGYFTVVSCTFYFWCLCCVERRHRKFVTEGALKSLGVFSGGATGAFHLPGTRSNRRIRRSLILFDFVHCRLNDGIHQPDGIKPDRLPLTRDAMYTLFFILGLMVFEVTQQGFWLAYAFQDSETVHQHIWVSSLFASLVKDMDPDALKTGHQVSWWLHLVTLLAFSNYVPWSKHSHVFAAPFNILFMSLEPKGAPKNGLGIDDEPELSIRP